MTVDGIAERLRHVCVSAARTLSASGAGVSLMGGNGVHTAVAGSDPTAERIEELQFTLGEGPCIDAFHGRRPVLVPDLTDGVADRWPAYVPAAYEAGVRAAFAFPLQVGAARLGVLDVFRAEPGGLDPEDLTRALTLADIAVTLVLDAGPTADRVDGMVERRAELFQAQGMVMVQLGISLTEAMARIRAHAFSEGRRLDEVAADIVARRLRFDRHHP